jgi:Xaa-Pro aminopeptidase
MTRMPFDLAAIQTAIREQALAGWLFYDFRRSDPIAYRVLGLGREGHATRRWFYFVPAQGDPVRIVHQIEFGALDALPGKKKLYAEFTTLHDALRTTLPKGPVAMQYSPGAAIPYVARVDAGTVELVNSFGARVVSSADLVQRFEAVWSADQWQSHQEAAQALRDIVDAAFAHAGERLRAGAPVTECGLQRFVLARFAAAGLVTSHPPILAVNVHTADPHYAPSPATDLPLRMGDFLLLDLWAKRDRPGAVYADYTWTAYAGPSVPSRYAEVFAAVRAGRDAAVAFLTEALADGRDVHGWEVDAVCRREIEGSGYGKYFVHRTGHSIGEEVHGNGANIDNFETQDDRLILPRTGFSIEPGVYLPGEFGVRSEIDVFVDADGRVHVTGRPVQEQIVALCP